MNRRIYTFYRYTLFLILFLLVISCDFLVTKKKKIIVDENKLSLLFGEKIELFPNLPVYDPLKDSIINKEEILFVEPKTRIVTRINGNCFSCTKNLLDWDEFIQMLDLDKVDVRIYLNTNDFESLRLYIKRWRFKYKIILDKNNDFEILNKIPVKSELQTFLLNEKDEIVLIGNPLKNTDLKDLYLKDIR